MHFRIKSVAEVVAERRNVVQEKYTGRGTSSDRFVQKNGEMAFFLWAVQHRWYMYACRRLLAVSKNAVAAACDY